MQAQPDTTPSNLLSKPIQHISVVYLGRQLLIRAENIVCLEADGNYTHLFTRDGRQFLVSRTLGLYADHLDNQMFVRIHKSYVINVNFLQSFEFQTSRVIKLSGGKEVTVSRRRFKELVAQIMQHKTVALA